MSLFDRLGGAPAFRAATDTFYRRLLDDPRVAPFFEGVDVSLLAAKQRAFLTLVTGGPDEYAGRDLESAHAHLVQRGLSDEHVDAVIEHLEATLMDLGAHPADIGAVAAIAESVRSVVLGRSAATR